MKYPLAMALLVACVPIIVALCGAIGPGRAARYAVLGVFLLMPRYNPDERVFEIFSFDKLTVAGLAMAVGVLVFDLKTLVRARPHWLDSAMILYVATPLLSQFAVGRRDIPGALDQAWMTLAEWGIPYALGRLYYGDQGGPRRLAISIVVAALICVPFCLFEMTLGGDWFLGPRIFGIREHPPAYRLGGWRPALMMTDGLELVAWMALSTVLSCWLWACRERWRPANLPAWLPRVVLLATTIACRGVYGYITLGLGLMAIGLLLLTRSRWVLAPLILAPLLYIGLRAGGGWEGRELIRLAGLAGDRAASSVALRIEGFENPMIREAVIHNPAVGLGGRYQESWADGWWLGLLTRGGLLAVAAHYAAFLLPASLVLSRRSIRPPSASVEMGLALFIALQMLDSLHNTPLIAVATMAGGSLVGAYLSRSGRGSDAIRPTAAAASSSEHATYRLHDLAPTRVSDLDPRSRVGFVLATASLLYIFGHAQVEGHDGVKFAGGLGSALLFGSVGAFVAESSRRSLARASLFGLAFAVLGVSFNLALHASSRPTWSADILQGMALSGIIVAGWRALTGGGPWAFAGLAALASAWWAFAPWARPFPGSQYLFDSGEGKLSLFPALPWVVLAAVGAVLVQIPSGFATAMAIGFGLASLLVWPEARPFGPPTKFPLNPTYAMLGASVLASAFAASATVGRWRPSRLALEWMGRRWLVFFYLHLGIAVVLARAGIAQPLACWVALASLSIAATWAVSWVLDRVRPAFRKPGPWAVLIASIVAAGVVPGLPTGGVLAVAWAVGLIFAALHDELAGLIFGPSGSEPADRARPPVPESLARYVARVAVVIAILVGPEMARRLPPPVGLGPRSVDDGGPTRDTLPR